jgi:hypothetical protein
MNENASSTLSGTPLTSAALANTACRFAGPSVQRLQSDATA